MKGRNYPLSHDGSLQPPDKRRKESQMLCYTITFFNTPSPLFGFVLIDWKEKRKGAADYLFRNRLLVPFIRMSVWVKIKNGRGKNPTILWIWVKEGEKKRTQPNSRKISLFPCPFPRRCPCLFPALSVPPHRLPLIVTHLLQKKGSGKD
jgi:hypothetical protein